MAAHMLAEATKISVYPRDGRWSDWSQEQRNMELVWHDVCRAALQSKYIQDTDLQEFQSVPRKPFGVSLKEFTGNIQGRWTENGMWLVAYPLLTADDGTWIARLDVFYFFTDENCTAYEYVKNPVLIIQHSEKERNTRDYISLAYDRDSKSLRLTPGGHLDEIDLVRHISIDIDKYKHREIFPQKLPYKDKAVAEKAGLMGSNFQEGQTNREKDGQKASEAAAALSVGAKRKRPIIPKNSEGAATASDPPGDGSSERNRQQARDRELEKALQKIKTLEDIVREQGVEITELKLRLAGGQ